jgi:UDP-N-acetylglucosamine 2-epimerase (non-hydrolysing)
MKENQDLYYTTTQTLSKLKSILNEIKPDLVLVQGDTTTTFTGALASFYERIPVGHVEAGLRSHNKYSPYPEEINRVFTDVLSELCFAPTQRARDNLIRENIPTERIWVTGNTAIDALFMVLEKEYNFEDKRIEEIVNSCDFLILVTAHRRESFDIGLENICYALLELKNSLPNVEIIYSVHPNPNVKEPVYSILGDNSNIYLIDPPDYVCFCNLMKHAKLILTDSGGIQEEAPSLGKPVLVMREVTERVEGIDAGNAILVGTDKKKIVEESISLLEDEERYNKMANVSNPYGDGRAGERIAEIVVEFLNKK